MENFDSIEKLALNIKSKLDTETDVKNIILMYAFNTTWKTRISDLLNSENEESWALLTESWDKILTEDGDSIELENWDIKSLCYNAFLEDTFVWNNDNLVLNFDANSWFIKIIKREWLDKDIISNFVDIVNQNGLKLEPNIDFKEWKKDKDWNNAKWEVTFKIASWSEWSNNENIKISKGEESMFIWSVFYTILDSYIDNSNDWVENILKYVIIDDPVSSIDDTKIISMAIKLVESIKKYQWNSIKFLISTHHALFYNILVNSFKRIERKKKCILNSYSLSKNNHIYVLKTQNDSPLFLSFFS